MLTDGLKNNPRIIFEKSDHNGLCQLGVDIVPAVLNGDSAAALPMGNDRNGLAAVAAQREQKRVQLFVVCVDLPDGIFHSFLRFPQGHITHRRLA